MSPMPRLQLLCWFSLVGLTACAPTLNTKQIEEIIQQSIIKQGGISLKGVTCPDRVKPAIGQAFECFGDLETGKAVAIAVKQVDNQGTVTWDVPSVKGLLNLEKLETQLQDAIQAETGLHPRVKCGSPYRAIKPGESFACLVFKQAVKKEAKASAKAEKRAGAKPKEQPDGILVTIDPDGNVNWQEIFRDRTLVAKATDAADPNAPSDPTAAAAAAAAAEPSTSGGVSAPAAASTDDFLNQPGSADGFD